MPHVVIVEDEAAIADTLEFALRADGFTTSRYSQAQLALSRLRTEPADFVILDVGLPDISGFEACKELRRFSSVPVLFLTARGSEVDRVVGLEIGADDYVVKPFSPREVATRVRTILRRAGGGLGRDPASSASAAPQVAAASSTAGRIQVDEQRRQISYRGCVLVLTRHEYLLLQALVRQPGRVLGRDELLEIVGVAADAGYERNVDGHIRALRAKLRDIAPDASPIQTHRGFGYSYDPEQT